VTGERLTVGAPFFNKWMLPIGLLLLLLTGIAPLLAWRKSSIRNLFEQFTWPAAAAIVTGAGVYAVGIHVWASLTCFALCAWVGVTILQEFVRGANVRKGATGTDVFTAMVGLVARSRRRYGGYIVHLGIVLMFLGFAGQGYKRDAQLLLKPGQQATVGGYTIVHNAITVTSDQQKQMITGDVTVLRGGKTLESMYPAKWFFDHHEQEPTSEVAIRRTPAEDLYIVLAGYDVSTQTATYAITINPLVDWIWFGFGILALGTGIALLPERAFAFATAKLPATAVTTGVALLMLLLPAPARAQTDASSQQVQPAQESPLKKQLQRDLMCTCGACRSPLNDCQMRPACHGYQEQNAKIDADIASGMNRDQILAAFVKEHGGQDILTAPIDRGFNRLAWLLPYVLGATGASIIGLAARRWARQSEAERPTAAAIPAGEQGSLAERLEDELRDLD
jgi:cytochrome c-type biogenesis protein CcmF